MDVTCSKRPQTGTRTWGHCSEGKASAHGTSALSTKLNGPLREALLKKCRVRHIPRIIHPSVILHTEVNQIDPIYEIILICTQNPTQTNTA